MIEDKYGNRKFYGIYRGVVYDNNDPIGKRRLRLQVPQIFAEVPTSWAWSVSQPGVVRATPAIGEGVYVMFEGGDVAFPLWVGTFSDISKGGFLDSPPNYGAFSDYTTQSISSTTTNYTMLIGQTDEANGVRILEGKKIVFDNQGVYNLQWSGQFVNPTTAAVDAKVWMRKNGIDVIGSTGVISIPAKHGTTSGHTIAGWNFVFTMTAGEYYEIIWNASDIAVTLATYTSTALPPSPSTASLVVTVTQVK